MEKTSLWGETMCDSISDIICAVIIGFVLIFVAASFFWIHVINKKKHVPKQPLSEQQKEDLVRYGLLHFTSGEAVDAILKDNCTIRPDPDRAIYPEEQNYTWFFPAYEPIEKAITDAYNSLKKKRKTASHCLHITGINSSETSQYLYNPYENYIIHDGELKKNITVYCFSSNSWLPLDGK